MIQIGRHIEILLLSNDCVIVPGLGGFVTHKISARYDEDDCIFLPPIRTLGFNPQLQINDSLLVISYVEAFDISYPEALRMIEAEVEELKQRLTTEGSYEMNGIGTLYLNKEGVVVFKPCEAGVLTPDLYALSSFDFARLPIATAPIAAKESTASTKTAAPVITASIEPSVTKSETSNSNSDNDDDDDSNYIHISSTWLKTAVAAAAILLIAIIIISPNETVNGYYSHMSTWSTELIQKLMPKDTNTETLRIQPQPIPTTAKVKTAKKPEVKNKTFNKAETETPKTEPTPEPKTAPVISNNYTIVLASSITENNAKDYIQKLKEMGYNDASVYNNGHIIRVVYGSFASEQNAQDSLRKLRDNKDFEEAWVLKIKN